MVGRVVLAVAGVLAAGAAPAAASPELTVSATHAKPTFLRSAPPNTTPHSGTLSSSCATPVPTRRTAAP